MATFRDDLIHLLKEDEVLRNKVKVHEQVKDNLIPPFIFVRIDSLAEHNMLYRIELFSDVSLAYNPDHASIELVPRILEIIQYGKIAAIIEDAQAFVGQQILGGAQFDGFIIRVRDLEEII